MEKAKEYPVVRQTSTVIHDGTPRFLAVWKIGKETFSRLSIVRSDMKEEEFEKRARGNGFDQL